MKRPNKNTADARRQWVVAIGSLNQAMTAKAKLFENVVFGDEPDHSKSATVARLIILLVACVLFAQFGAKTLHSALHVTVGRDARAFYYGSRVLLSGKNPYDDAQLVKVWVHDQAPLTYKPGLPSEVFVYPPVMALLFAPAAFLPWQQGTSMVVLSGFLAAVGTILLLCFTSRRRWNFALCVCFACYAFLLPATRLVIAHGQSTFVVCACLAASLYAFSRKCDGVAGLFLGLSLAKFTLTFPFLALLVYRRQWRSVAVAMGSFCLLNAILVIPIGILKAGGDFLHLVDLGPKFSGSLPDTLSLW